MLRDMCPWDHPNLSMVQILPLIVVAHSAPEYTYSQIPNVNGFGKRFLFDLQYFRNIWCTLPMAIECLRQSFWFSFIWNSNEGFANLVVIHRNDMKREAISELCVCCECFMRFFDDFHYSYFRVWSVWLYFHFCERLLKVKPRSKD